jgi:hypothetical protein
MQDNRNSKQHRQRNKNTAIQRGYSLGSVQKDKENSYLETTLNFKKTKNNKLWKLHKSFILTSIREEFMVGNQDQYTLSLFKNTQIKNLMIQRTNQCKSINLYHKEHLRSTKPIITLKEKDTQNIVDFHIQGKGSINCNESLFPPLYQNLNKSSLINSNSTPVQSRNLSLSTLKILSLLNKNLCFHISQSKEKKILPYCKQNRYKDRVKLSLLGKNYADKLKCRK